MLSFFLLLATALNTSFNANAIRAHVKFLSSDLLEGRGPGTRGDALAQSYIATQFESYGLETSLQKVALLGITPDASTTEVACTKDAQTVAGPLKFLGDFVGGDQTQGTSSTLDSEVVFVGHGVVAPEYKWDDYKGLDTRGRSEEHTSEP